MKNTNDVIRSLGACTGEDCQGCCYDFRAAGGRPCVDEMLDDARDALTRMQDRCARYAEEIMVLRERLEGAQKHG